VNVCGRLLGTAPVADGPVSVSTTAFSAILLPASVSRLAESAASTTETRSGSE